MRKSRRPLVIVSRKSKLARAQTEMVGAALGRLHPGVEVMYRWIESEGDQLADAPLSDAGGKGLFAGALERELLAGRADLAVHSLKDLPPQSGAGGTKPTGLVLAAIPAREDVRDCLVAQGSVATLEALPRGATLGTASPRRAAQVLRLRPDLQIKLIRGNIETRIRKVLEDKQFDATLLAVAGLRRAGLDQYAAFPLDPAVFVPAAGQGALALQCRADDHVTLLRCLPFNDAATATAVHVERGIVAALHGDCHSSIATHAQATATGARVLARVLSPDGRTCLEAKDEAPLRALGKMIKRVVASLQGQGAVAVLKRA